MREKLIIKYYDKESEWIVVGLIKSPHGIMKVKIVIKHFEDRFLKPGLRWLQVVKHL